METDKEVALIAINRAGEYPMGRNLNLHRSVYEAWIKPPKRGMQSCPGALDSSLSVQGLR